VRREYVDEIFSTLKWLGFRWQQGPQTAAEFYSEHSQLLRVEEYRAWLKKWPGYACDCSRQSISARTDQLYDGFCRERSLPLTKDISQWRLRAPQVRDDIVLWRKLDLPAYHLVSLVEDLKAGVNLIVRGEDLRASSEQQLMLAAGLGSAGESFLTAQFIHHPLLLSAAGEKLSKSQGHGEIMAWREAGKSPREVWEHLSRLVGHQRLVANLAEWPTL
jgi:glutamyl-tRNA synthetase